MGLKFVRFGLSLPMLSTLVLISLWIPWVRVVTRLLSVVNLPTAEAVL